MEVCGGQTHSIVKYGLDSLLPDQVELVHGPGCPVCVTSLETIDRAHAIARKPDVIFCSFGDMLRVPGSNGDLFRIRAEGGERQSGLLAARLPEDRARQSGQAGGILRHRFRDHRAGKCDVGLAGARAGYREISPCWCRMCWCRRQLPAFCNRRNNRVQAFLGPGHVCAITGWAEYEPIVERYRVPVVITGFEPIDILQGVLMAVRQLEQGRAELENAYARAVRREGNPEAQRMIERVFRVCDRSWRGIGMIPKSGFALSHEFRDYDAARIFEVESIRTDRAGRTASAARC